MSEKQLALFIALGLEFVLDGAKQTNIKLPVYKSQLLNLKHYVRHDLYFKYTIFGGEIDNA